MSTLSSLKLVAARKPSRPSGLAQRRHKLSNKLAGAGELDAMIDTASQSLREGLAKRHLVFASKPRY